MRYRFSLQTALALMLAALLSAGAALAEKPDRAGAGKGDKQARKHEDKAERHRQKKSEKHADKHERKRAKNDKHGRRDERVGGYFDDRHQAAARAYYAQTYHPSRGCPPGLAKKNNGCMPPGQAKKYRMGEPLPREVVYYPVPQPVIVQLPAVPAGYRYVRVGNDILLLSPASALVVDVIVNIFG